MLKIYWADADRLPPPSEEQISDRRRATLATLRHEGARQSALCAERLLLEAVSREDPSSSLPLSVETEEQGKPYLTGRAFEFNLSHTGHYAGCAIADYPVGLDLQMRSPCSEKLVRRFFAEKEQQAVFDANDRDAAFTRLWCRKESLLKAIGCGLRSELSSFDVSGEDPVVIWNGKSYSFFEYREGELFFCLCAETEKLLPDLSPVIERLG